MQSPRNSGFSLLPPILFVVLILGLSVLFNMSIIDVRMQELDKTLTRVSRQQDLNKSLNMLAKYSIIKRRMERGYEDADDYTIESKVMAVIASDFLKDQPRKLSTWNYIYPVVKISINAIRLLMGKSIVNETGNETDNRELEVAYFYERNRRYEKALDIYGSIIKAKKHTPEGEAYIILHQGFCQSMIGDLNKARASYEAIISRFPDSETAAVAWKLLEFINTVDDELQVTRGKVEATLEYGKRLYLLMDYKNAITVFSEIERKGGTDDRTAEAIFLKARCYEELGEVSMAVEDYKKVIKNKVAERWAKEANRRIFILGEFYERDKEITRIAMDRLKEYRDENFFDELNTFSGVMGEETKVTDELRVKQREQVRQALTEKDVDVLSIIDKLDLSGEEAAKKEVEEQQQAAVEAKLKAKEMELKHQVLDVSLHPQRKPSFIAREIQKRCIPLQSLYNTRLKRGDDFSGTLKLVFSIEASGKTGNVQITEDSDIMTRQFRDEVLEQVGRWEFPAIEDKYGPQKVTYPIEFKKRD